MFNKIKKIPEHIGIILDGNRRWAKKHGLTAYYGHKEGVVAIGRLINSLLDYKIKFASVYAFSTENWKRDKEEINGIFSLVKDALNKSDIFKDRVKVNFFGDISVFDQDLQDLFKKVSQETQNNTELTFNICLNYGGKADIVQSVNKLIKKGNLEITEKDISNNLYSAGIPDIDLVIRTSGEQRISNFMIYQIAYAELYFPKLYWPEFNKKALKRALIEYSKRHRRYGGS